MKDRIDYIKNELRDEIKDKIYELSREKHFALLVKSQQLQAVLYKQIPIFVTQTGWGYDPFVEYLHESYYKVVFDGATPNIEFVDNSVKEEPTLTNKSIDNYQIIKTIKMIK